MNNEPFNNNMTVKDLKNYLETLPDDMMIGVDVEDRDHGWTYNNIFLLEKSKSMNWVKHVQIDKENPNRSPIDISWKFIESDKYTQPEIIVSSDKKYFQCEILVLN